ncbi:ABC transporter substrate-binding protein [Microbacterium tumbae]
MATAIAAMGLIGTLALSGCGGAEEPGGDDAAPPADFDAVVEAAKQEGQVTVYTSIGNETVRNALVDEFQAEYPEIVVNMIRLDSGPLTARVASEMEAGSPTADVMQLVDNVLYDDNPEWFRTITPDIVPNVEVWPDRFIGGDGTYVHQQANEFIVAYNSDQASDVPTDWEELANWDGLGDALMANPNSSASFMGWAMFIRDEFGDELLTQFADNVGGMFESSATAAQQVAAGEVPVVFPSVKELTTAAVTQGAPIERQTTDPVIGTSHIWAIPDSAGGSPNAGALFLNFMMSKEAAQITCMAGDNFPVAYDDIPDCPIVPDGLALIADYFPDLTDDVRAEINEALGL